MQFIEYIGIQECFVMQGKKIVLSILAVKGRRTKVDNLEKSGPSVGDIFSTKCNTCLLTPGRAWAVSLNLRSTLHAEIVKTCFPNHSYETDENLLYRSGLHGRGLNRFWANIEGYKGPVLMLIAANSGDAHEGGKEWIIGALTDQGLKNKDAFYGTSGSLYALSPVFHTFSPSDMDSLQEVLMAMLDEEVLMSENKHHVCTLKRDRLVKLDPSENFRGRKFLKNIRNPMNDDKLVPLAFAYDGKLYVLSRTSGSSSGRVFNFEVYSPSDGLWRVLARRPLNQMSLNIYFQYYLVLGTKVYFTTSILVVVCFDLKAETWGTFFDPYGALTSPTQFIERRPLFQAQTQVIGNRIFGIFTRKGTGPSDICASSSWKPHENFFLRPNLAPDKKFFHDVFGAPTKLNTDISAWRTHMFTLDEGARIMGVVCYSNAPYRGELSSFATLSIFQVDAESHSSPTIIKDAVHRVYWNPGMFSYARKEDRVEYFRAKLLQGTSFFIYTRKEFTYAITGYGVRGIVLELKALREKSGNLAVSVEGFNVFKGSTSEIVPKENDVTDVDSEAKKEYHRQMEIILSAQLCGAYISTPYRVQYVVRKKKLDLSRYVKHSIVVQQ
ncbi:hypothetical protein POM88_010679 [Heracleum sosnowskyi]|uniref:TLDc domain-containing protein n=1 Tax=Heracleum sosnowskyi TaxID=360622 RepID=A0AAD8N1R4_9APIA|nr:hypothetical protein POM88_010679 [Heracleum sosnowskyi]